jgi:hypothetical protein
MDGTKRHEESQTKIQGYGSSSQPTSIGNELRYEGKNLVGNWFGKQWYHIVVEIRIRLVDNDLEIGYSWIRLDHDIYLFDTVLAKFKNGVQIMGYPTYMGNIQENIPGEVFYLTPLWNKDKLLSIKTLFPFENEEVKG